jgi:hypothetical protein
VTLLPATKSAHGYMPMMSRDRLRIVAYNALWVIHILLVLLLAPLFWLFFAGAWVYRRLFPDRWKARLARADAASRASLEWVELHDPQMYRLATGRTPRPPAEISPRDTQPQ